MIAVLRHVPIILALAVFSLTAPRHARASQPAAPAPRAAAGDHGKPLPRELGAALAELLHRPRAEAEAGFAAIAAALDAFAADPDRNAEPFAASLLAFLDGLHENERQELAFRLPEVWAKVTPAEKAALGAIQVANLVDLDWLRVPRQLAFVPQLDRLIAAVDAVVSARILGDGPLPTFPTALDFDMWMRDALVRRLRACGIEVDDGVIHHGDRVLGYAGSAVSRRRRGLSAVLDYWTDDKGAVVAATSNPLAHTDLYYALGDASRRLTHDGIAGTRVGIQPLRPGFPWDVQEGYTWLCGTAPREERAAPPYPSADQWDGGTLIPLPDPQLPTLRRHAEGKAFLVCAHRRWVEPLGKLFCGRLPAPR